MTTFDDPTATMVGNQLDPDREPPADLYEAHGLPEKWFDDGKQPLTDEGAMLLSHLRTQLGRLTQAEQFRVLDELYMPSQEISYYHTDRSFDREPF